jgi:putative membrane protein
MEPSLTPTGVNRTSDNPAKRNLLAVLRTRLANERTFLSYVRTSLYFLVGGVALLKVEDLANIYVLGWVSLAISFLLLMTGIWRFVSLRAILHSEGRRRKRRMRTTPSREKTT